MSKPLTENLKSKIELCIKNGEDISDLIQDVNIKGMNLSRALIKRMVRINEDLSNTLFVEAKFGQEGSIVNLMGCNLMGCNFTRAVFYGTTWFKRVDARNATFRGASLFNAHFEYSDFRNVDLCGALVRLSVPHYLGTKCDDSLFWNQSVADKIK